MSLWHLKNLNTDERTGRTEIHRIVCYFARYLPASFCPINSVKVDLRARDHSRRDFKFGVGEAISVKFWVKMGDNQAGQSTNVFLLAGISIITCVIIHFIYKTIFGSKKKEGQNHEVESDSGKAWEFVDNENHEVIVSDMMIAHVYLCLAGGLHVRFFFHANGW